MPALITEALAPIDTFMVVRDKIAALLKLELEHQYTLTGVKGPRVFLERSRPWGEFTNAPEDARGIVNVCFDASSFDGAASNIVSRQKCDAVYNLDCYGYGASTDDGNTVGGHNPADREAALESAAAVSLVRQILMSGHYAYLDLPRGTVWKRWVQTVTTFQPQSDNRQAQVVIGSRIVFQVSFNELSPQVIGEVLELINLEVKRAETGEIFLIADYPSTP